MNSVQVKVAEQITNIAPKIEDSVVTVMVDRELKRRSDALVQALDKLVSLEKDLGKIKPDQVMFDATGAKVQEYFSKGRLDEKGKLEKQISKTSSAINKALEKGDFGDVYNIASGKPPAADTDADTAEAA